MKKIKAQASATEVTAENSVEVDSVTTFMAPCEIRNFTVYCTAYNTDGKICKMYNVDRNFEEETDAIKSVLSFMKDLEENCTVTATFTMEDYYFATERLEINDTVKAAREKFTIMAKASAYVEEDEETAKTLKKFKVGKKYVCFTTLRLFDGSEVSHKAVYYVNKRVFNKVTLVDESELYHRTFDVNVDDNGEYVELYSYGNPYQPILYAKDIVLITDDGSEVTADETRRREVYLPCG